MNSHSKKNLVLMILCNVAAVAGYYFLFQYIKTQTKAASSLTNTIDLGQQKNSHLSALRAVVKDTEGKRQEISAFFLSGDSEISFIEQIEALGKSSGLSVKTNNVSSTGGAVGAAKTLQIQTATVGSWNNTLYFLSQVEDLPYNIRVQDVSLSRQTATDKKAGSAWAATFDISVTEST